MRVLLIDDETRFLVSTRRALSLHGLEVLISESAGEALPVIETSWPEVIVLDVSMPGMDGVSFCRLIRDRVATPILMLTARDSVEERVAGLDAGADDYLTKPFALDELLARLRALHRRSERPRPAQPLQFAGISLDPDNWEASFKDRPLALTSTEFRILEHLLKFAGRVVHRDALVGAIWDSNHGFDTNVVDVHVGNLRRKLEAEGSPRLIQTIRGAGYSLRLAD
jgi:two-component system response regulator MprA